MIKNYDENFSYKKCDFILFIFINYKRILFYFNTFTLNSDEFKNDQLMCKHNLHM